MKPEDLKPTLTRERLMELAEALAAADPALRVVRNEQDNTAEREPEAATFLKLCGVRLGRDLEMYGFMSRLAGAVPPLSMVLEEILLPIKLPCPAAFAVGIEKLRGCADLFGEDRQSWLDLLDEMSK